MALLARVAGRHSPPQRQCTAPGRVRSELPATYRNEACLLRSEDIACRLFGGTKESNQAPHWDALLERVLLRHTCRDGGCRGDSGRVWPGGGGICDTGRLEAADWPTCWILQVRSRHPTLLPGPRAGAVARYAGSNLAACRGDAPASA